MCTLAVLRELGARYPLIVAANRDEFYARPTRGPALLEDPAGVKAGIDVEAGGTWLGYREEPGVVVAGLLNRRQESFPPEPRTVGQRSRGLLCLDALAAGNLDAALGAVEGQDLGRYQSFNLFLADRGRALVIDNASGGRARVTELDRGLSVLTGLDVNDPRCPRLASAVPRFEEVAALVESGCDSEAIREAVAAALGDHGPTADPAGHDPFARLCVHAEGFGTRSASLLIVRDDGAVEFFHADGPPCRTELRGAPA